MYYFPEWAYQSTTVLLLLSKIILIYALIYKKYDKIIYKLMKSSISDVNEYNLIILVICFSPRTVSSMSDLSLSSQFTLTGLLGLALP